jgi:rubrerythrin
MKQRCQHSCRDKCRALEFAEILELQAIKEYTTFRDECDYPDVKSMLSELIGDHERILATLHEKREQLSEKFTVLDLINESFEEDSLQG